MKIPGPEVSILVFMDLSLEAVILHNSNYLDHLALMYSNSFSPFRS